MVSVPLPVALRRAEVLRLVGYPEGRDPSPRVDRLVAAALDEARGIVAARGAFRRLPAARAAEAGLGEERAETLVLGLVTVGSVLEARAAECAGRGETSRALVLDAAGSAAVEEAADRLCALIVGPDAGLGDQGRVSCRISPGYGSWPLVAQPRVFDLLRHADVGVRLLPSLMMVPRKSVSFAMWLGDDGMPIAGLSGCDHCPLDRCAFRRGRRP